MKWGSRKAKESSTHGPSADHLTVTKFKDRAKGSGVKSLSNEELQKVVTRMNLEQQHRNLMGQQPNKFEKGHAHVKKVLAVGKTLNELHSAYKSPVGQLIVNQVKKKFE